MPLSSINGFAGLGVHAGLSLVLLFGQILWAIAWPVALLLNIGGGILWLLLWNSYVIVNPNEAVVAQFFGKYVGTLKREGFRFFINPLYEKSRISMRINNFESSKLKVNDVNANPINIAAVVVWRVYDGTEAMFEVEKYEHYVQIQSEATLKEMATKYPYDAIEERTSEASRSRSSRTSLPKNCKHRWKHAFPEPASPFLRLASATLLIPRRSRRPCFAVNKPAPWLLHGERSSMVLWAWLSSHLNSSSKSLSWTKRRKRPW